MDTGGPADQKPQEKKFTEVNAKEKAQKLLTLEMRRHSIELARFQSQRFNTQGGLRLPSLASNSNSAGLLPSPLASPNKSTVLSPGTVRRQRSIPSPRRTGVEADFSRTRPHSSGSAGRPTSCTITALNNAIVSPKLLRRRQTASHVAGGAAASSDPKNSRFSWRRCSEGVVPAIEISESQESLQERVQKFNQTLAKSAAKLQRNTHDEDGRGSDVETRETSDDLLTAPRPAIGRSRSLPSLIPVLGNFDLKNESAEPLTFYEDLKRCRYLRMPDSPKPLTVEQIFQNKQEEHHSARN